MTWGTGTGTVTVNASNSCGASSNKVQSFTGISCREDEQQQAQAGSLQLAVYPNPAHDKITVSIHAEESSKLTMQLTDIWGRVKIIFITSFNQYAIEAIRYSAFDYLLKPIKDEELKNSISRFRESTSELPLKGKMENLLYNIGKGKEDFMLIIPTRQGEKKIPVNKIVRCEADSNYTHFYLSDKIKFTASKTLKEFEEILSENDFIRIHKSHIVNKIYVQSVSNDGYAQLKDGLIIEISRRRLTNVKQSMN